ncbi:MAG: hypothetical protein HKN41_02185 [Ilumatobacter sp.]|nr:hypothetical protein [Ilumatobacter sp.]
MTTIDTRPDAESAPGDTAADSALVRFFVTAAAWVTSTDHKRIGRLFTVSGLLLLIDTAVVGLLLGLERVDEGSALLDGDALLQLFQTYRFGLVFATLAPMAIGLAVAVVPMQLGARSIAYPRLAMTGFYAWLGGAALVVSSLIANGGVGGGDADMVDLFLAGHGLMILGLLAAAGCVATTVLTTRAPGMTMRRVPLFSWSSLIGALGMLVALPVAFGTIIYLFLDHRYEQFNFGGGEGIAGWVGWVFTVPAVIVFAVPAVGVAAELIPVAFRTRHAMRGVAFAGIALVGVAALAAATQQLVHDVTFDTSVETFFEGAVPTALFSGLPLLGLAVVMALGALTAKQGIAHGRPRITAPFVFGFFGLGMVLVGVLGNLVYGITDLELIGTSFEEGATIYVTYGTALAVMGGVVFWAPKLWGRTISDGKALPLALLGVTATVLASLPLYIAAFLDQAGGYPVNDADVARILAIGDVDGGSLWVTLSLAGHALMALTVVAFLGLLLMSWFRAPSSDDNPYEGHTIEWSLPSPAPSYNYEHVPTVASPTPQLDLTHEGARS